MSYPIKSSTDAATCREEKAISIDQVLSTDADIDTTHSVMDQFGYPMWSHPTDQGVDGNTEGVNAPISTDSDGDDSDGA